MRAGYRTPTADELELERKRREFPTLEHRLARLEHELDDLRDEIREFEQEYSARMAGRLAELDQLHQELAKARTGAAAAAETAAAAGACSDAGNDDASAEEPVPRLKPVAMEINSTDSLRDVYRKVAKAIHPDFSRDDEERKRRQKLMAEANRAYAEEDRVTLQAILEEWEEGSATIPVGRAAELTLLTRRIARLTDRIRGVEREIVRLKHSDIYCLIERVKQARWRGQDVMAEMAAKLDVDILAACRRLNEVARPRQSVESPTVPAGFRVIRFAPDRSLGTLYVRERNSGSFLDWKRLGTATGDVTVPAGKAIRLDVQEGDVAALDRLGTLKANDIQACFLYGATDADLTHLLRLSGISELYLSGDGITSEGVIHLLELKNLERLYLYDTQVTDAGIFCLKYLHRLRSVTLCNTPVTEPGLDRLRLALPGCRIVTLQSGRK